MAISFACPRCGKKLKAPDNAVGQTSRCPGCGTPVTCPEPIYEAEVVDDALAGEPAPYVDLAGKGGYGLAGPGPGVPAAAEGQPAEARRPCPMCGEMIVASAAKCRYCGEIFDPALKKARTRGMRNRWRGDDELSGIDIALAVIPFCTGIGCIVGLIYAIQGKPKGGKMLGLSIAMGILWNIVGAILRSVSENGGP
jgi:predicted RNA-binding Zn-ribbon protein involved in translation (DUF1610 family)